MRESGLDLVRNCLAITLLEYSHDPSCFFFSSNSTATNVFIRHSVASKLDPIFEEMSSTDCGASESCKISKTPISHAANSTLDSRKAYIRSCSLLGIGRGITILSLQAMAKIVTQFSSKF